MKLKEKLVSFFERIDENFLEQFGFRIKETTFPKVVEYLHRPKDSSSLAVTRILFGIAMLFDIPDERGGATMMRRWGDPYTCHFPLIPFVQALPMPYMALVYTALWLGAPGITLGFKYRISSIMFTVCYWYLFLIEKSYWNNHSYLFGLVGLLLSFTEANCYWSLDAYLDPTKKKDTVPYWNYFVLKYQFFILYFMAGMKKGTAEWLTGYSVQRLSEHWVFDPFKLFLTVPQIDYLIVHWFIFMFDLTVAIWMMWSRSRHIAVLFCALFHLMNSRLFRIGMFPWVCLATMPLYYPFDWPKLVLEVLKELYKNWKTLICKFTILKSNCQMCHCNKKDENIEDEKDDDDNEVSNEEVIEESKNSDKERLDQNIKEDALKSMNNEENYKGTGIQNEESLIDTIENNVLTNDDSDASNKVDHHQKLTTIFIILYVVTQAFLPYSHFITKGYNNWTDGLYGYSWDMMVHTWDVESVVVKVVDNENKQEHYIDHSVYSPNFRWTRHGDMVYQYAHCLKDNLLKQKQVYDDFGISDNFSIYVDVWCSMNGRFTQRLFDPKIDLLQTSWSPFSRIPFLMPLLDEAVHWRATLLEIAEEVHSWNNKSDVIFLADFPHYEQTKYIPTELGNITLTILKGEVAYENEDTDVLRGHSYKLSTGNHIKVESGIFHTVFNIGENPAYYMYTFSNNTEEVNSGLDSKVKPKLPIMTELFIRFKNMIIFSFIIGKSAVQIILGCNGDC